MRVNCACNLVYCQFISYGKSDFTNHFGDAFAKKFTADDYVIFVCDDFDVASVKAVDEGASVCTKKELACLCTLFCAYYCDFGSCIYAGRHNT